jgi:hypothetical protein
MMIPTAMSTILPFMANALNSSKIFIFSGFSQLISEVI